MRVPRDKGGPFLTYDRFPFSDESQIAYFRSTNDLSSLLDHIDRTGLAELNMCAGASLSSTAQVRRIVGEMGPNVPLVVIVDTRQESHAKVNEYAATLRGERDLLNAGMTHEEVKQAETQFVASLREQDYLTLYDSSDIKAGKAQPRSVTVYHPLIMSEREMVERVADTQYLRLGTSDHCRPGREDVDAFINLVRSLPKGAGIYLHCKGGRGRTTTYTIMYDMLHNAAKVSFDDIVARQSQLGAYRMLNPDALPFKRTLQQDRMDFLKEFYEYAKNEYAKAAAGGEPLLWSEWRQSEGPKL